MEKCKMKNVVVLKNLPSNLIEEAFVIVKSKKVAKRLEYIETKNWDFDSDYKDEGYVVREAESVLSSYVKLVEKKEDKKVNLPLKKKYNIIKFYGIFITIAFAMAVFFL